jgi:hypothetical protein
MTELSGAMSQEDRITVIIKIVKKKAVEAHRFVRRPESHIF